MNDDPDIEYNAFDMNGVSGDAISELAQHLLELADHLPEEDPKFDEMIKAVREKEQMSNNKIMLFSTLTERSSPCPVTS